MSSSNGNKTWRFLSNHTQVLLCLQRDPDVRYRDIAEYCLRDVQATVLLYQVWKQRLSGIR